MRGVQGVFFPSVTANIHFWPAVANNIPAFVRYARSQSDQVEQHGGGNRKYSGARHVARSSGWFQTSDAGGVGPLWVHEVGEVGKVTLGNKNIMFLAETLPKLRLL
jgi:hypothetical protein